MQELYCLDSIAKRSVEALVCPIPMAILPKYVVFCKIAIGKGIQGARAGNVPLAL